MLLMKVLISITKSALFQNAAELNDKWRKQIKLSTLSSLVDKQKLNKTKKK
jgi:carboxyl-terminal processing protease